MPDTFAHYAVVDGRPAADPLEDARRWLDRAAKCERLGYIRDHCLDQFEAALERAGLTVIGEIAPLLRGEP